MLPDNHVVREFFTALVEKHYEESVGLRDAEILLDPIYAYIRADGDVVVVCTKSGFRRHRERHEIIAALEDT